MLILRSTRLDTGYFSISRNCGHTLSCIPTYQSSRVTGKCKISTWWTCITFSVSVYWGNLRLCVQPHLTMTCSTFNFAPSPKVFPFQNQKGKSTKHYPLPFPSHHIASHRTPFLPLLPQLLVSTTVVKEFIYPTYVKLVCA